MKKSQVIPAACLAGTAALGISLTACGSTTTVREIPVTHTVTAAPLPTLTKTVTAKPAPVQPAAKSAPARTVIVPTPVYVATPVYVPQPQPQPQQPQYQPDPYSVVSEYYNDIEAGNFSAAWSLQDFISGGYSTWVAGYADTGSQFLTENSESGDSVSVSLAAYNTAIGTYQYFQCSYTVDSGIITSGTCTQTW